jgi:hypothetical protein
MELCSATLQFVRTLTTASDPEDWDSWHGEPADAVPVVLPSPSRYATEANGD